MNTPEQGYRRTRIATVAIAALGVTVFGGSAALAYLDTYEPDSTTTVTSAETAVAEDSTTAGSFGTAPRVTEPTVPTPNSTSGSGSTHAQTHGS